MATIPRITTDRLLLREARRTDFDAYATILMDPKRRMPPGPVDRRTAWRHFIAMQGSWMLDGIGWWTMEDRETGAFVGNVGTFLREPPPGPNDEGELEVGWSLAEAFRGRGLATEGARAMVAHVIAGWKPPRLIAHVDHDNPPSIRVAEKLGMVYEREVDFYDVRLRRYVLENG